MVVLIGYDQQQIFLSLTLEDSKKQGAIARHSSSIKTIVMDYDKM